MNLFESEEFLPNWIYSRKFINRILLEWSDQF